MAKLQVEKSLVYAYRDRKAKKRDFRGLWIVRINAAARENEISYSRSMDGLKKAGNDINRKMLADLAVIGSRRVHAPRRRRQAGAEDRLAGKRSAPTCPEDAVEALLRSFREEIAPRCVLARRVRAAEGPLPRPREGARARALRAAARRCRRPSARPSARAPTRPRRRSRRRSHGSARTSRAGRRPRGSARPPST